jgi:uncharacterized membrane protein
VWAAYPLVPWIGVMAVGYAFGAVLTTDAATRKKRLLWLGLGAVVAFVVLRAINVYGDRYPWSPQGSPLWTLMSFLDCSKYPPSLAYLLMTLGPAILVLRALDGARGEGLAKPILLFGRVPMFFYMLHLFLIHSLVVLAGYLRYGHFVAELAGGPFEGKLDGWGFSLPAVYGLWAGVVVLLYPACAWFAGVKKRRNDAWLRFI